MKLCLILLAATVTVITVSKIDPSSGKEGTVVTISGANFGADCSVRIGHTKAVVKSASDTELVVVVPPSTTGKRTLFIDCKERAPFMMHNAFEYK